RLEPDFSTTDRAADGSEDPQHGTDDQENDADRVQNGHLQEDAQQQEDESKNQHDLLRFTSGRLPPTALYPTRGKTNPVAGRL
ncbi:hypothetical protein, partial [Actinoplanes philippinensis]|uniref:hypothetical protein n=1 Tax=Actinoplanes philippinensis TaxID=35752 RepID=UPI0033C9E711